MSKHRSPKQRSLKYPPCSPLAEELVPAPVTAPVSGPAPMRVGHQVRDQLIYNQLPPTLDEVRQRFAPPVTLGANEDEAEDARLAMDSHLDDCGVYSLLQHALSLNMGAAEVMPQFPGYAYLSGLAQNGLIRAGVETTADEMTRRWIRFRRDDENNGTAAGAGAGADAAADAAAGTGTGASTGKGMSAITPAPQAIPTSRPPGYYPGSNPSLAPVPAPVPATPPAALLEAVDRFNLRGVFNDAAAKTEYFGGCLVYIDLGELDDELLMAPLILDPAVFRPGSLRGFTVVEPINVTPGAYNASDPLRPDYFRPAYWQILGRHIHASRFLYFSTGEMPVLLRPAYNFFGIPTAQLALDYVAHFTQNRECASRLLNKFSLTAFKTNMSGILQGGAADDLDARLAYFVQKQSNDGCFVLDKDSEDLVKLETSLGGVTDIVRQSLEFVAAIFRLPVTKFLGVSPAGFNPTGEADRCNLYDYLASRQEKVLRAPLQRALEVLQMNALGRVDPRLTFDFVKLDPEADGGKAGGGDGGNGRASSENSAGNLMSAGSPASANLAGALGADDNVEFKESEHPRDEDGKFAKSAGGGAGSGSENGKAAGTAKSGKATAAASAPQHSAKTKTDINKSKDLGAQIQQTAEKTGAPAQPIKPLSRAPEVYQKLVEQFPYAADMTYNRSAMILVQSVRDTILEVAEETNLPPEAIAACMLDENTSIHRVKRLNGDRDKIQDLVALGLTPGLKNMRNYVAENPTEATRSRGILNPPMWDIGPYNLNTAYCYELFEKNVLSTTAQNPLRNYILQGTSANASDEEKWRFCLTNCLLDPRGGVYMVAAALQDGQAKLAKYMQNSSPEIQAALLVSSFKLGFAQMESRYKERTKDEANPPDMLPGEGARMFYNIGDIWEVLYGKNIPTRRRYAF